MFDLARGRKDFNGLVFGAIAVLLVGCATAPTSRTVSSPIERSSVPQSTVPEKSPSPNASTGMASFYSNKYQGMRTASGEIYDGRKMTAAHRSLPFGVKVRVTDLSNNRSVIVRINDRGPFTRNRIIDLSLAAARQLGMVQKGSTQVRVEVYEGSGPRADLETR